MSKLILAGMMWIGIDVSKYTFFAAIADESAKTRDWCSLPVREFTLTAEGMKDFFAWLRELGITKRRIAGVCIEATGRYSEQWSALAKRRVGAVSIVNPACPRHFAQSIGIRDKSDRVDACVMALYGKAHEPRPTHEDSKLQRQLRDLARARHTFETQCQAHTQRVAECTSSPEVRASLKRLIAGLQREIRRIDESMQKLIASEERMANDLKRATTVTGIGTKTAMLILAEFGDLRCYNRDQLVALAGLYPREFTSGVSVRKRSRLAKAGKASVRAALYMCAMSAIQADPHIKTFASRLETNGKEPMQIIVAVMRKLLMTVRAVVVSETDYDPNFQHGVQFKAA